MKSCGLVSWAHTPHFSKSTRRALIVRASRTEENSLFVFGLGYTGLAACNYFRQKGWYVSGTTRSEDKAEALRAHGFDGWAFDADGFQRLGRPARDALVSASHVISTVPPDGTSDPVLASHACDIADSSPKRRKWVGYVSSTSVYGDHQGAWVDEDSDLLAVHGNGLARMLAEGAWLALAYEFGTPVHVFRCGGIYGPGRSALESQGRGGGAGPGQQQSSSLAQERRRQQRYTARCHVLDICRVFEASASKPRPGAVYNVVDNDPAGRSEVELYAKQLLGGGPPGTTALNSRESQSHSTAAVVEAAARGEKRVKNELMKRELGVHLEFPTYREGLAAVAKGDRRPFAYPAAPPTGLEGQLTSDIANVYSILE